MPFGRGTSLSSCLLAAMSISLLASTPALAQVESEQIEAIEERVSEIRELDVLTPIQVTYMTRDEFAAQTVDDFMTDYPDEDVVRDRRTLVAFGVIDEDLDLREMYSELYGGSVLGYYDSETSELVVIRDSDDPLTPNEEFTLAHEINHALQDQHFDLDAGPLDTTDATDDASIAVDGLVEGDAVLLQALYLQADPDFREAFIADLENDASESPDLDSFPPLIVALLYFPYEQGFDFAAELYSEGGYELLNSAFENPPATTEQILHPEKYLEGETAAETSVVDPSEALGDGWQQTEINTWGEFLISQLLIDENVDEDDAADAAAGWNGDSYIIAGDGDDTAVAWTSKWDSDDDAEEFVDALVQRESDRLDADAEESDGVYTIVSDDLTVVIQLDDDLVTYASAPTEEEAVLVLDAQFRE